MIALKKKAKGNWKNVFAELFELPKDVIMDLPRMVLIGNMKVVLENHRGIIEYGEQVIRIAVNNGEILFRGKDLQIKSLITEELSIEGVIESIEYEE